MAFPLTLQKLKIFFKKLPGVGERTAERFAFDLLGWKEEDLKKWATLLIYLRETVKECSECGALFEEGSLCPFCTNPSRSKSLLCVVASPKEIFSLESIRCFDGLYHVLGGYLSPLDQHQPIEKRMNRLKERIIGLNIKEIFLALDATLEGDATAHFIKHELRDLSLQFTRPAFGLPLGSPLEGIDRGTLARAILGRSHF